MTTQVLTQTISEKISFIIFPKINLRKILVFGFILITLLLIFYILQLSEITRFSFSISRYEQEITDLSQQSKNLEAEIYKENSLSNLEAILSRLNYEKVSKIYYIKVLNSQVASKP